MTTFYCSNANTDEARSVARGLPLFIRDHYKLKPSYFCGSDEITKFLEGEWNFSERSFLTSEEKDEKEKFAHLIYMVTSVKEGFISKAHKVVMAIEGYDVESIDTRFTKGYEASPTADVASFQEEISNITEKN